MNTNDEIKQLIANAVLDALAPLVGKVKELEQKLAQLTAGPKVPENVAKMQTAFKGIPAETLQKLEVVMAVPDPKMPWMALVRQNGTQVSIKMTDAGFRVRLRDQAGELLKELTPTFNGLNAALAKLAESNL